MKHLSFLFLCLCFNAAKAQWVPLTSLTGWNADVIAESSAGTSAAAASSTNNGFDGTTFAWCSSGYRGAVNYYYPLSYSLPNDRQIYVTGCFFTLQPYNSNNDLKLVGSGATGTLGFTTPVAANALAVLIDRNYNQQTYQLKINFTDGTSEIQTFSYATDYNLSGGQYAFTNRNTTAVYGYPIDWTYKVFYPATANRGKPISSVTFTNTYSATNVTVNVYAVSYIPYCSSYSLPATYASTLIFDINKEDEIWSDNCGLIARVLPSATLTPGTASAKVWVEATQPVYHFRPYVKRHYEFLTFSASNNFYTSNIDARYTLFVTQAELNDFNAYSASDINLPTGPGDAVGISNLRVFRYSNSNTYSTSATGTPDTYSSGGTEINPADTAIVWDATNNRWAISFTSTQGGGFFIGSADLSILPLSLMQFSATHNNQITSLQWRTATEQNTAYFNVQRSADGSRFTTISKINAAGNSTTPKAYSSLDDLSRVNGLSNTVWYRLEMTDRDGSTTYSSVLAVRLKGVNPELLVFPNPVSDVIQVQLRSAAATKASIQLVDVQGRLVFSREQLLSAGNNAFALPAGKLASGQYLLLVTTADNKRRSVKVWKQ